MKTLMMFVCLAVAIIAGLLIFAREPGLVMLCAVGWVGFIFFRHRIRFEQDEKSHAPVHKPRNRTGPTKVPSQYD